MELEETGPPEARKEAKDNYQIRTSSTNTKELVKIKILAWVKTTVVSRENKTWR